MRIGLCTPCYEETVHNNYMLSVMAIDRIASKMGWDLRVYLAPGTAILPRVRNRLVAQALTDECDWIVFVDDDIGFNADDFFKLFKHGVDVVAAAPAKRHHRWDEQPQAVAGFPKGNIVGRMTEVGRIWRMDAVATGFMAIKIDVIKRLEAVTKPYTTEGVEVRDWFWLDLITVDGQVTDEGEDYNFCRKFREVGGEVWVDPDIRVRHYTGSVCHDLCLADMEQQSQHEAA